MSANNLEVLISLGFVADEVKDLDTVLTKLKEIDAKKDSIAAKETKAKEGESGSKAAADKTQQMQAMEKLFKEYMPDKEDKSFSNEITQLRQEFGNTFNQLMIKGIFPFASNPVQSQTYLGMYDDAGDYIKRYLEGKKDRFDIDTEKNMVEQFTPVVQNAIKNAVDMLNAGYDPQQNKGLGNILASLDLLKTGTGTSGYNSFLFKQLTAMVNELTYQGKVTGRYLTNTQTISGLENSTLFTQVTRYNPEYTSPEHLTPEMKQIKDIYDKAKERQMSASAVDELNKKISDYEGGKGELTPDVIRSMLPLIKEGDAWIKQTRKTPLNISKDVYDTLLRPAQGKELSSLGFDEKATMRITMDQLMKFTRPDESMLFPKDIAKALQKDTPERKTLIDFLKLQGGKQEYTQGVIRMLESKEFAENIEKSNEMVRTNIPFGRFATETKQTEEDLKNPNTVRLFAAIGENAVQLPIENIDPTRIEATTQLGDPLRQLSGSMQRLLNVGVKTDDDVNSLKDILKQIEELLKNKSPKMVGT